MTAVIVQLHPFNTTASALNNTVLLPVPLALPHLRLVQAAAVDALPQSALATAVDAGDPLAPATSLHPRNKQRPGRRAAAAVLALALGVEGVPYLSPRYASSSAAPAPPPPGSVSAVVRLEAPPSSFPLVWEPPSEASNSSRCPVDLGIPAENCGWFALVLDDAPFPNGTVVNATGVVLDGAGGTLTLIAELPASCPSCKVAGTANGWDLPLLPWREPLTPAALGGDGGGG
jgi:hypothetical protein